jgi:hypothetical protein
VQVVNDPLLPANATDLIKAAIVESFNGGDGKSRARIGSAIIANRFVQNIVNKVPYTQILDIDIGTTTANLNRVDVPIDKTPTLSLIDIVVTYV